MDPRTTQDRAERLLRLTALELEELCRLVGETAVEIWRHRDHWPDLVERCLQVIEEEVAAGRIPIRMRLDDNEGAAA